MQLREVFLSAAPAALASLLAACSAQVGTPGTPAAQTVAVTVSPDKVELVPSQTVMFAAAVTGTVDTGVTWEVVETTGGGVVDQTGLYTAPGGAGTYHVRVRSHAVPTIAATATVTVFAPPPTGSVAISPKSTTVASGGKVTFTAAVSNLSSSAVTWSVQEASCGSVAGGVYTAPVGPATCHVVATSVADPTKADVATVAVSAPATVTVSVTPSAPTIDACTTQTLRATVSGSSDQTVTWSVLESGGGTVTSAGVYTAPSASGTYHVVATARASASATARATIVVQDHIVRIDVVPGSASLAPNGSQQFAATVTTTCGTFAATAN